MNIPETFFMPYCVCPHCGVEALHWMREPSINVFNLEELYQFYESICRYNAINPQLRFPTHRWHETAKQWAEKRTAGNTDVIRDCRECGRSWGQRVGDFSAV